MNPFVAEIRIFPFNFPPKGWALCNGQLMPISQNTALFSLLGTTYGGDGKSNFALPNMQGNAPMHPGQGPGLSLRDLGETGGSDTVTLLESEMPAHSHVWTASNQQGTDQSPVKIAKWALDRARTEGKDVLIVDTSGRLHIDKELMGELAEIKKAVGPHDVLLVVDAMTGQDAVNVAEQFAEVVDFDGVVMTKLDGDARGGAALSVKAITGKPIMFASTGEKLDQFERFHPDRMAQRILGMGDVMTLIEKAQDSYDEQQQAELERKLRKQEFGLDDFLDQMRQVRRLGPLQSLLGMIPGLGSEMRGVKVDEREFDRLQAIILSMTPEERRRPELIKGSRRLRIAQGSGTNVQAVKLLIKQFDQMRKVMRQVAQGRTPDLGALMRQGGR